MSQFDFHCPNCQHRYSAHSTTVDAVSNCPKCGQKDIVGKEAKPLFSLNSEDESENTDENENLRDTTISDSSNNKYPAFKYPTLRTIANFYKFLAYGVGVVAIISFIVGFVTFHGSETDFYDPSRGAIILLVSLFGGAIAFLTLLAMSEGIMLFVNMANDLSKVKMSLDDQ